MTYVRTGLERGLAMVRSHTESGAGSPAFGVAQSEIHEGFKYFVDR
jgi:hypothetical protein